MSVFKKIYFISFVVAGFVALYIFNTNAQEGSDVDIKWHNCAKAELDKFGQQDSEKIKEILCNEVIKAKLGPECNKSGAILFELGLLEIEINKYLYNKVITPVCGEHPTQ